MTEPAVLEFPGQISHYRGKVRDVYSLRNGILVMVVSDRVSAFDVILPRPIPFKGQVLNQIAAYMLKAVSTICPVWLLDVPSPNVSIGMRCEQIKIEVVVRGNLVGHAWREYASGKRTLCGANMSEGLREFDFFPSPILTPTTKAEKGHDQDIAPEELLAQGLVPQAIWEEIEDTALKLFDKGRELANKSGLILADTKYEFGILNNKLCLMDEVHTPDSSRYFYLDGFENRQSNKERQPQLSKEFVREWLMQQGFMGKEGQTPPIMGTELLASISEKYIGLYETLVGQPFIRSISEPIDTIRKTTIALDKLGLT